VAAGKASRDYAGTAKGKEQALAAREPPVVRPARHNPELGINVLMPRAA
jgi:hypothetical protein